MKHICITICFFFCIFTCKNTEKNDKSIVYDNYKTNTAKLNDSIRRRIAANEQHIQDSIGVTKDKVIKNKTVKRVLQRVNISEKDASYRKIFDYTLKNFEAISYYFPSHVDSIVTIYTDLNNDNVMDFYAYYQYDFDIMHLYEPAFFIRNANGFKCVDVLSCGGCPLGFTIHKDTLINGYKIIETTISMGGGEAVSEIHAYLDTSYEVIKSSIRSSSETKKEDSIKNMELHRLWQSGDTLGYFRNRWQSIPFESVWYEYQKKRKQK